MKFKKEYLVLAVLILALVAYLWLRPHDRTRYTLPTVTDVQKQSISKIELGVGDSPLLLEKKDERWVTPQGYRVTPRKVTAMVDALDDLTLTALISESKDYARYDLDPENKITVKAWADGTLVRDFAVGKVADSFRHTFVQLNGDSRVYQARQNLRETFDQTVDTLRDKTVLSFSTSDINQLTLTTSQREVTFTRQQVSIEDDQAGAGKESQPKTGLKAKMAWRGPEGQTVDESKINQLIATLSHLECEGYIDDRNKSDFNEPTHQIQLAGTRTYSLSIFAKMQPDDTRHPAVSSESDDPFFLPEWRVKDVTPALESLLTPPEAKQSDSPNP